MNIQCPLFRCKTWRPGPKVLRWCSRIRGKGLRHHFRQLALACALMNAWGKNSDRHRSLTKPRSSGRSVVQVLRSGSRPAEKELRSSDVGRFSRQKTKKTKVGSQTMFIQCGRCGLAREGVHFWATRVISMYMFLPCFPRAVVITSFPRSVCGRRLADTSSWDLWRLVVDFLHSAR